MQMHCFFWKLGFGGLGFNKGSRVWPKMADTVNVLNHSISDVTVYDNYS